MRALVLTIALSLGLVGAAMAHHLDPQERIRAVDQQRASAMLLRLADLPAGYAPERTSGLEPHITCRALDQSDLVLTGRAKSPNWAREYQIVGSYAAIHRTVDDARAAWRRSTSRAGLDCLRLEFRNALLQPGENVRVTIRELPSPKLSVTARTYRMSLSPTSPPGQPPQAFIDVVLLTLGRAQAGLVFVGIVSPPAKATEVALSRLAAKRMRAALGAG